MKSLIDPPAIVAPDETRMARIPIAMLQRFERLEAEMDMLRSNATQHGEVIAHQGKRIDEAEKKTHGHSVRLAQVEVDIDELQRRKAVMLKHLDEMRCDVAGLFDIAREQAAEDEG